ncbi:DNA-binding protein YbiB [Ramlibacter sp. H39-3-26]|uniref:DNA-binding protein YbiB n=1 Tax=Curvibacter soli TaxID=3031331 RepID=UPI0023D9ACFE|nr:DNA-binding protein YbiB [Ramlibacter sp. H39-3-26]MDF1485090.1 DNA-binding protein YbiB [Ramlibacter sp. H39-3-26]
MSISQYIKEIGRGARGARPLAREQAADLFGQVLDGAVTDLEVGAFCLAMRIKGETADEMAGFLDATHARLARFPATGRPLVVLPSYNGARRLPVLTPLLALLLARQGLPVLLHGAQTEARRVTAQNVLEALDIPALAAPEKIADGEVAHIATALLHPGLQRLLEVRQAVGLRNPGHSAVKLMNPGDARAIVVTAYTHPEYFDMIGGTFALLGMNALLSRGLEGEVAADPRRSPRYDAWLRGEHRVLDAQQPGTLAEVPGLPTDIDAASTAAYTRRVLEGGAPVPAAIARQVGHITELAGQL